MHKLFLDANILFTATYSCKGASYLIFELARKNKITIFSSRYAIKEAQINIISKIGEDYLPSFYKLISVLYAVDKKIPLEKEIQKYNQIIAQKDSPILISAIKLKVDYLITLDKRDFRSEKVKKAKFPFIIMLPGEYIKLRILQS